MSVRPVRSVLVVLTIVTMVVSFSLPVVADDSTSEVTAMYAGDYKPDDAATFHQLFTNSPTSYTSGGYESNKTEPYDDVTLSDILDGSVGDPGIDDCDVAYYSSHGRYSNGDTWFEIQSGEGGTTITEVRASDVGDVWDDSDPRYWLTNSRWDSDVEWVFLACCSQLNTYDSYKAVKAWARTLVGYPDRAHGIFGYRSTAPGDGTDVNIVNDLYDYVVDDDYSIKDAWKQANVDNGQSTKWAAVVHLENVSDRFWGAGTVTGDTSYTSSPNIYLYTSAGQTELYSVDPGFQILREGKPGVACQLPQEGLKVKPVLVSAGSQELRSWVHPLTTAGWQVTAYPSGAIHCHREPVDAPVTMDAQHAVATARAFIESHGGLPSDAGEPRVIVHTRTLIDIANDRVGNTEPVGYLVEYQREINGVPVSGMGRDTIRVEVDAEGVGNYFRLWRHVINVGGSASALDPGDAWSRVEATELHKALKGVADRVVSVEIALYAADFRRNTNRLVPVWRYTLSDGTSVHVDAVTGKFYGL